jgi:transposase
MAGIKGMKSYPQETKLEAVRLLLEEGLPKRTIMKRFGIRSDTQIENWARAYRKDGTAGLVPKQKGRSPKQGPETLEEKIRRLEMENEILRSFLSEVERG